VNRGIPTTLNTPALDPVLMYDGRQPTLQAQAAGAIQDHAQGVVPSQDILTRIRNYQLTEKFFSSEETRSFAAGGPAPGLPRGNTDSEKRGRIFFEDVIDFDNPKHGFCAACHAGPMLNQTNAFLEAIGGPPAGSRFQNILISERNVIGNLVQDFVFNPGLTQEAVSSPDIGRSAITGVSPSQDPTGSHFNAFKIPTLRGIRDTGPYFHDNSAKTLEDVLTHYAFFFNLVTGGLDLSEQDKKDVVAFLKLLR
jgi:cytochrome c peroxidase